MSQSRRAPAFRGRLRAPGREPAIEAGSWLLSHGLPLAPPLPLPLPRRAPPQGLALARRLRGGGAAGNGCAPFGSSAVLALLPAEAGALPAVLMGHGGEGSGQRGLPGAAGPPEGRRCPVLQRLGGPGRHPPGRPAPHPGAAAALEAGASSDQGSQRVRGRDGALPRLQLGCVDACPCILPGAGPRGARPLSQESFGTWFVCLFIPPSILVPKQSQAHASLDLPHTPPLLSGFFCSREVHLPTVSMLRLRAPPPVPACWCP